MGKNVGVKLTAENKKKRKSNSNSKKNRIDSVPCIVIISKKQFHFTQFAREVPLCRAALNHEIFLL